MKSTWFLLSLLCCAPVTSQIVQLSTQCPGGVGALHFLVVSNPFAGSSLQVFTQTALTPSPPPLPICPPAPVLSLLVMGFQDPNTPLTSCGCALRVSPMLVDSSVAFFALNGICYATTNRSISLPASSAGIDLYMQSFGLMPPAAATPGMCSDFGFPFMASQAYRITVQ